MDASKRLVSSRKRRDISTASKVLDFVSIDQLQWIHDTDGRVTLREVHYVKPSFAFYVDQVFEVPTNQIIDLGYGSGSNVVGVILIFQRDHSLLQMSFVQVFHFVTEAEDHAPQFLSNSHT
jgi:hypothetical protein